MTVSTTTNKISYAGNGSTTAFAFSFRIFAESDLRVILRSSAGVETVQTLTTHYTISASPWASGGTVTMVTAPASGETLVIKSDIASTQGVDYLAADRFPAETHEAALDKLTLLVQQNEEALSRAPVLQETTAITNFVIPDPETNQILVWDGSSFGWVAPATLSPDTVLVSSFAETVLDDTTALAARATLGAPSLQNVEVFTSGGTWTKPSGLVKAIVVVQAQGGGGGYANSTAGQSAFGTGGGGGGAAVVLYDAADLSATETVTLANTGGAGGVSPSTAATAGSNAQFGSHITCAGGSAGSSSASGTAASANPGGAGGGVTINDGTTLLSIAGQAGGAGCRLSAAVAIGGAGGNARLGLGGGAAASSSGGDPGNAGTGYGGGGGGASDEGGGDQDGGDGADGIVIVYEYY